MINEIRREEVLLVYIEKENFGLKRLFYLLENNQRLDRKSVV